ncbi:ABC-three component system protein [Planctellipticum variicoloris]|uniref:ABC-three component system protein n=1 Tax=Planctellipticum variicoloris TaxID=3064265 RepID=UPI0030141A18|nr:hypothetical protein SH412_003829 [Planctomycetaceae bacterium SH412]
MAKNRSSASPGAPRRVRRSSSVPGTYRGFSLQANRFLFHLMQADLDSTVSLEAFEDVGVQNSSGSRTAEQNKSFLTSNPLADRSAQLWKTLANWFRLASDGTLPPANSKYVLYAHTTAPGQVARLLNDAIDDASALAALSSIRAHLRYPDGLSDSTSVRDDMLTVLNAPPGVFVAVTPRISIICGSLAGVDELKSLFTSQIIGPESVDETIQWSQGWIKERIDKQISQNQPCYITKREFHDALITYVRHHDRISILKSIAGTPDHTEVQLELAFRKYVRQLQCIALDEDSILSAVNDYLRAVVDRTRWSEEGHISSNALDALADELVATWRNKTRRVALTHATLPEEHRGQLLYTDCIEHSASLDGLSTPPHFIRGSWQVLSDDLAVGWHPRYSEILTVATGVSAGTSVDTHQSQGPNS